MKQLIYIKPTDPLIVCGIFEVENNGESSYYIQPFNETYVKESALVTFLNKRKLQDIPEVVFLNIVKNAHVIINSFGGSYNDAVEPMEIIPCDNAETAEYLAEILNKELNDAECWAQAIYSMNNTTYNISNYKDALKIEFIDNIINYKEDDTLETD